MRKITIVALLALLSFAPCALAWNQTGHMVVALITWRQLDEATKQQLAGILKAHPHYTKLLLERKPSDVNEIEWAFLRAAVWPDMVRPARPGIDVFRGREITQYHRAYWHYIDFPYYAPGFTPRAESSSRPESSTKPAENILTAIDQNLKTLAAADAKSEDRAVALGWIEHLVGDIHQPLHAASLFSTKYPSGDRGGNEQTVRGSGEPTRLHAYWDDVIGTTDGYELVDFLATRLMTLPMPDSVKTRITDGNPKNWAQESHDLAVAVAYLSGTLRSVKTSDVESKKMSGEQIPALPPGYENTARDVSEQRITMAGLRLAEKIKTALKP